MIKIGIGMPGISIAESRASAQVASEYNFDSFSVYGDLGDLPPYAILHATADVLRNSAIQHVGPMGVPVGLQHPEVMRMHAVALEEQLPGQSYIGLVRGAFLEQIGTTPASLKQIEDVVGALRCSFAEHNLEIPLYLGGFGQKLLRLAGRLSVQGVKLGGSTNPELANNAKHTVANPEVSIVMGAVSVIDPDRKAARILARRELAKYLRIVGEFDMTLNEDERNSRALFYERFDAGDELAFNSISESLLDKFAIAGTPDDAIESILRMDGVIDRFELGTPQGLGDRPCSIRYIGESIIKEIGE